MTQQTQEERDLEFERDVQRYARSLRAAVFTALTNGLTDDQVWDIVGKGFADVDTLDAYRQFADSARRRARALGIVPDSTVLEAPAQRAA